jgi:hypothetical protein
MKTHNNQGRKANTMKQRTQKHKRKVAVTAIATLLAHPVTWRIFEFLYKQIVDRWLPPH